MEAFVMIWRFFFPSSGPLVKKVFRKRKAEFSPRWEEWTEGEKLKQEMRAEKRWANERAKEKDGTKRLGDGNVKYLSTLAKRISTCNES